MISILLACRGLSHVRDCLTSVMNNAYSLDSFEVLVKLDECDPDLNALRGILEGFKVRGMALGALISPRGNGYGDLHKAYMDLYTRSGPLAKYYWVISDDCLVLGRGWDRYIVEYGKRCLEGSLKLGNPGVFVVNPMADVDYAKASTGAVLTDLDNYPVWSADWVRTCGFGYTFSTDGWTNMILRELELGYMQRRRIFCPKIGIMRKRQAEDLPGSDRWRTVRSDMVSACRGAVIQEEVRKKAALVAGLVEEGSGA